MKAVGPTHMIGKNVDFAWFMASDVAILSPIIGMRFAGAICDTS